MPARGCVTRTFRDAAKPERDEHGDQATEQRQRLTT
jgi:hypothetical protein